LKAVFKQHSTGAYAAQCTDQIFWQYCFHRAVSNTCTSYV